jgi:hypothetical protein
MVAMGREKWEDVGSKGMKFSYAGSISSGILMYSTVTTISTTV